MIQSDGSPLTNTVLAIGDIINTTCNASSVSITTKAKEKTTPNLSP
jgi:hypothetical protein